MENRCICAYFNVILKGKKLWSFWNLFLTSFWYIENLSCLNVPFGLNIVLMYFFKAISFHFKIYWVIYTVIYTVFKTIHTSRYLILSDLLVFTGFLGKYFLKHCWKSVGGASIFSELQTYENICCGFFLLLTWNNTWNNYHTFDFWVFPENLLLHTMFDVGVAMKLFL